MQTKTKITYEFMPFDVNVNSIDTVLAVVEGAGADNGGIVVDTWHMAKLGISPGDLRRIPLEYLTWVELSDGQFEDMEDQVEETTRYRRLPGEGEFDIPGYIAVCLEIGYDGRLGHRGALGRAASAADRGDVRVRLREDDGAVPGRRRVMGAARAGPPASTAGRPCACWRRCGASACSRSRSGD